MSDSTPDSDPDDSSVPAPLRAGYRTVTRPYRARRDAEMDAVGWTYLLVLVLLFVPFLPLLLIGWLVSKLFAFLASVPGED